MIALRRSISLFIVIFYFAGTAYAQTDENNSISGHVPINQSHDIRVILDHIFISNKNDSLEISEIVVFRNEGREIYYSKDNHTFFAISIPPDAKNLKTRVMECCLVQEEGMVYMDPMQHISQGANFEMQISYTLFPQTSEYVFNKSAVYNTSSLLMFFDKKSGMSIDGSNKTMTLAGNEYKVITFNDLKAGEIVSIQVKILEGSNYLYAGIGLFSLFSIFLVYRFREKIFMRKKKDYTLEELEIEKRKIFQAIYGFEKHAGPEKSEGLGKFIEENRLKAIKIFIKIDNLNNKRQSELSERG
ncbi:Uncharacterised protein [uncultured archaeon]|nr:Uncharacterised protein [uncultured archaeon]